MPWALAAERSWRFEVDAAGPGVASTFPAEGARDAALTGAIVLEFSEPLAPSSVNAYSIELSDLSQAIPASLSVQGATVTLVPSVALQPGRSYRVSVRGSVADALGNPMGTAFELNFMTDQGRFAYPVRLAPAISTDAMAIGDVNGDGMADVVLTSGMADAPADESALFVAAGRADGSLGTPARTGAGRFLSCWLTSVAIGDLDGDGRNEVVVGGNGCGAAVFRQGSGGSLVLASLLNRADMARVRLADLDGDGRAELLGGSLASDQLSIWRQNAAGELVLHATPGLGATGAADFEVADVNGDGRPDLVAAVSGSYVAVLRQQADGSFAAPDRLATDNSWGGPQGIAVGDLNGDGRKDVVIAAGGNWPNAYIGVFHQRSDGSLGPMSRMASHDIPLAVRVADLDGDGRADVIVSHQGWMKAGIYLQQADGTLAAEELFIAPYGNFNPHSMAVGDVNRDGRPDIALAGELLLQKPGTNPLTRLAPSRWRTLSGSPGAK
ncbi:FG-GAP-like repeat-containing protein [Caldimonas tepidiphila]|uniref:FG-GAP-like repeat-containing protein n=1 Tax=Caldimonas tepidiphila TaxID=2315841 RepID=UPI001473C836|nr:FG-GAP-like repeat-containing protein [Caldimonas tepidiphila]